MEKKDPKYTKKVLIVGAGLAGSDAAFFLAEKGISVVILEGKTITPTAAQKMKTAAELVCTNSLKSLDPNSGHGLLKEEMALLGSLILECGKATAVPAGDALAVDRDKFSQLVQERLKAHPLIDFKEEVVSNPIERMKHYKCDYVIVASGPLTTKLLEEWIIENISKDDFYFYDAIAPVVDADSLDMSKMYFKDRHKDIEEGGDYLNCPLTEEEYYRFIDALVEAEKVPPQNFEELKYFESCLPIDTMATRGRDTARFSCMKPIGLEQANGKRPFAAVQLRKENLLGQAYNLVGFQTRLKYSEQLRVFRMLPGLENASFLHLGSVHRNSFINSKKLLNFDFSSKDLPGLHFAGQMTGVEGYTESAAMGLYVAFQIWRKIEGKEIVQWPVETGIGALVNYIMTVKRPVPSNINFGLLPKVELTKEQRKDKARKKIKKSLAAQRAKEALMTFKDQVEL